jgi:hypothetical protein
VPGRYFHSQLSSSMTSPLSPAIWRPPCGRPEFPKTSLISQVLGGPADYDGRLWGKLGIAQNPLAACAL